MNIIYPKAVAENSRDHVRYELAAERVRGIKWETIGGGCVVPEQMRDYFAKVSSYLVQMMDTYEAVDTGSFYELSLEELQQRNRELYQDILPENYDTSYANPAYAAEKLGNEFGRYLCALYG